MSLTDLWLLYTAEDPHFARFAWRVVNRIQAHYREQSRKG